MLSSGEAFLIVLSPCMATALFVVWFALRLHRRNIHAKEIKKAKRKGKKDKELAMG
jgi:hypothetical protein